jgi:hypothetical protein
MARARNKRRIRKEELALAVRKHFKEAPVVENECLVELLYRIKVKGATVLLPHRRWACQTANTGKTDKAFRLKFPAKPALR